MPFPFDVDLDLVLASSCSASESGSGIKKSQESGHNTWMERETHLVLSFCLLPRRGALEEALWLDLLKTKSNTSNLVKDRQILPCGSTAFALLLRAAGLELPVYVLKR